MMTELIQSYISVVIGMVLYMKIWFAISVIKKRNDVADIAWGLGFIVIALGLYYINVGFYLDVGFVVLVLTSIWGIRLSSHIYMRNKNRPEDPRYKVWRDTWGRWFYLRSFFQVFILQGFLLILVATPIIIAQTYRGAAFDVFVLVGTLVWLFGFLFESIGDFQLKTFLRDPLSRGKIMNKGLWKYTRHPNYFGEIVQWWGMGIIVLGLPFGWLGLLGPMTITFLIVFVSGIPLAEASLSKNPSFEEYKLKTSLLIPWFSKK